MFPIQAHLITSPSQVQDDGKKIAVPCKHSSCHIEAFTYSLGLSTPAHSSLIVPQLIPLFLSYQSQYSHHSPKLISVYLPPFTYFRHQHPFSYTLLIHSFLVISMEHSLHVISMEHSLHVTTLFRSQLFYSPIHYKFSSFVSLLTNFSNTSSQFSSFVSLLTNFSNTSSQSHSFFFTQHFPNPRFLRYTMPVVQLLPHTDTSSHTQTSVSQHT